VRGEGQRQPHRQIIEGSSLRLIQAFVCCTLICAGALPARADFVTIPAKQVTQGTPVTITQTSVFFDPSNPTTFRACVSFKNTTQKPLSQVVFTFRFDDLLGNAIAEQVLTRNGSFGPGIPIEGKMTELGGNSDSFNNCVNLPMTSIRPASETIGVTSARFEDGTTWKKGDPLPGSPTATSGGAPGSSTVNVNGATGSGGTLSPSGAFGAIAWVPGSRKVVASQADEQSQTDADYGALSKCNTLNGGGTACKIIVQMSGTANKCGAVALDEGAGRFAKASGPSVSDTIRAAQDALVKVGGTLAPDSVVAVVCNTR
jgi:hypothetical protein